MSTCGQAYRNLCLYGGPVSAVVRAHGACTGRRRCLRRDDVLGGTTQIGDWNLHRGRGIPTHIGMDNFRRGANACRHRHHYLACRRLRAFAHPGDTPYRHRHGRSDSICRCHSTARSDCADREPCPDVASCICGSPGRLESRVARFALRTFGNSDRPFCQACKR
jgi:hypothetical protein